MSYHIQDTHHNSYVKDTPWDHQPPITCQLVPTKCPQYVCPGTWAQPTTKHCNCGQPVPTNSGHVLAHCHMDHKHTNNLTTFAHKYPQYVGFGTWAQHTIRKHILWPTVAHKMWGMRCPWPLVPQTTHTLPICVHSCPQYVGPGTWAQPTTSTCNCGPPVPTNSGHVMAHGPWDHKTLTT